MAVKLSGGRAEIIGSQIAYDLKGTAMIFGSAGIPGTAYLPSNCIGAIIYSPNIDVRARLGNAASTAVVTSGYLRGNTEYALPLNPGLTYISMAATAAGTPQITWVVGAGA